MYKKVVKFSFTKQKIFWVLVFSFMYLVSVDPMDRSSVTEIIFFTIEDKIREIPTQNVFVQVLPTIEYRDCTVVKLCDC